MKKKTLTLVLVVALALTAVIGGTLAYFTDTDEEVNTFTAGGVAIDLIEQERNDGGDALQDFTQEKVLMPIVGSAQGEKDTFGLPVAENYVDKVITISNTSVSDAWVRAYFAIPSALDDGKDTFNAAANILHFNFGNKDDNGTFVTTYQNEWIWKSGDPADWKYYETTIDGVAYNVYFADYYEPLAAGSTTERFVNGVYLDKNVDMVNGEYVLRDGNGDVIEDLDLSILKDEVKCPVFAVAVQAAGFDNATEAVDAAFGAKFNPWGGPVTNWQE